MTVVGGVVRKSQLFLIKLYMLIFNIGKDSSWCLQKRKLLIYIKLSKEKSNSKKKKVMII